MERERKIHNNTKDPQQSSRFIRTTFLAPDSELGASSLGERVDAIRIDSDVAAGAAVGEEEAGTMKDVF